MGRSSLRVRIRLLEKVVSEESKNSTPPKIIILNYGENPPVDMEGVIIIEVLPEADLARQILNESGVSNGLE